MGFLNDSLNCLSNDMVCLSAVYIQQGKQLCPLLLSIQLGKSFKNLKFQHLKFRKSTNNTKKPQKDVCNILQILTNYCKSPVV